jgi:hypothetical protein
LPGGIVDVEGFSPGKMSPLAILGIPENWIVGIVSARKTGKGEGNTAIFCLWWLAGVAIIGVVGKFGANN